MKTTKERPGLKESRNRVVAAAITCDRIDISWETIPGAREYRIYQAEAGKSLAACDRNLRAIVHINRFEDRELKPDTSYHYTIIAVGANQSKIKLPGVNCATSKKGLFLTKNSWELTIHGDTFKATWNAALGGEITEIKQYDGHAWVRVNALEPLTVPGFTLTDNKGTEHKAAATRTNGFAIEKNTGDEIVFSTTLTLNNIRIGFRYLVFKEGLIFCELSMPKSEITKTQGMPADENKQILKEQSVRLELHLNQEITREKFRWGYFQRGFPPVYDSGKKIPNMRFWKKASESAVDSKQMLPIATADFGLNKNCSFTNHLEFFIEDTPHDGACSRFGKDGQGRFKFEWSVEGAALPDLYFLAWDMGFLRTRWGLCLGASRKNRYGNTPCPQQNNLIGARIFHAGGSYGVPGKMRDKWPFNVPPLNLINEPYEGYPGDSAINRAKALGANVIIMHQSWMRSGGSNGEPPADYIPRNPVKLKRFVQKCHRQGIRVGLYMRGIEKYALFQPYFENFLKHNFDGLYVDWSSPYNLGFQGCSEIHFSAFNYFLFTKALRRKVGNKGFLIAHSGIAPTMLAFAAFDAYLPGEVSAQKKNFFNSPDEAVYHGFLNCVGTNPIPGPEFSTKKAIAFYAGLGLSPHVPFGSLKKGPACNFMAGLWKIWMSVPIEKAYLYNNLTENFKAAETSNKNFCVVVYKVNRNLLLLVAANLGNRGSAVLKINMPGLGLTGEYEILEIKGAVVEDFKTKNLGITSDGLITTEIFKQYEYRGYRLKRIAGVV